MSPRPKRFYRSATVAEAAGGFTVALDGRAVRTPAGTPLVVADRGLAEALAAEWNGQGDRIEPATMALTQLVSTALDRVAPRRAAVAAAVAAYAATDMVCYRAGEPADLAARQAALWQPLLDWAALRFDALLRVTTGVVPIAQPADALDALARAVAGYDDLRLSALQSATVAAGSLIVALALIEGRVGVDEAFAAACLDELYQLELWGDDAEAAARRAALEADLAAAAALARRGASG